MKLGTHKLVQIRTRDDVTESWVCEKCGLDVDYIYSNVRFSSDFPSIYNEWRAPGSYNWNLSYKVPVPLSCEEVRMDNALE